MHKITYKVPDGKLIKLKLELDDADIVNFFELRGDFFMYPEDGFLEIEKYVIGKKLEDSLFVQLAKFVADKEYEIYGFSVEDLKDAIYSCLENYES